ncbi:Phr family secreted Rap phosphatase inhibitor [Bacillus cereus]|nr:Phr family secreted Rap phosphatase inhibitor [Bacillus cereus]
MKKTIGKIALGIAFTGIFSFGLNANLTSQAGHEHFPAPQKPDFVQSVEVSIDYNSTTVEEAL